MNQTTIDKAVAGEKAPLVRRQRQAVPQPLSVASLPDALLKIPTAAAVLGVSISTVNRMIKTGELVAVRRGARCTRLRSGDVAELIRTFGA